MNDRLGERIKRLRRKANLTQSELAGALHVSPALISAYELGSGLPA